MNRWTPADFDGARLIWIETPANPSLDVCDVAAIVAAAHARGALVIAVVNPISLALMRPPGEWGARGADIGRPQAGSASQS